MNKIKFNSPYITGKELYYIKDVFRQNQFFGVGKYTLRCEKIIWASFIFSKDLVLLSDPNFL